MTNKGEDKRGWIRFYNEPMGFETFRQTVFLHKNGFYKLIEGAEEMVYPPVKWDTSVEGKLMVERFTTIGAFEGAAFDTQRYGAYLRCLQVGVDLEDPYLSEEVEGFFEEELFKQGEDFMTPRENMMVYHDFLNRFTNDTMV